jgi:predicted ATPase
MNLKNVNLFIGKNGAGKSHLLREIYKVNQLTSKHIYICLWSLYTVYYRCTEACR